MNHTTDTSGASTDDAPPAPPTTVCTVPVGVPETGERLVEVGVTRPSGELQGVVVWCHGLGASRETGAGIAATWTARGYAVVMPTFADAIELVARRHPEIGLDPEGASLDRWAFHERARTFMIASMLDWPWRHDRILTLRAVIDALPSILADDARLGGGTGATRIGVGGHSFGAYVTQLVAGARIDCPLGPATSFRDRRVSAVVIASGQGRRQAGLRDGSWDDVVLPLLNVTGTRDRGATTDDPTWKWEPFTLSPPGAKYQLVIDQADHGLGGISGASELYPPIARHLELAGRTIAQFWDAFLADDTAARDWLDSEAPAREFGAAAIYERR